jgi:large subunit ribosomal protein L19
MDTNTLNISPVNMEDRKKLGIRAGDTVRVWVRIQEKGKTRLQAFEGLVLAKKHGSEPGATFTVRKVSSGVGIERIFPLYSPNIDKIEVVKRAQVRRSKLYHIREKVAREIKRQMRKMKMMDLQSMSESAEADRKMKEEEVKAKATEEVEAKVETEDKIEEKIEEAEKIVETSNVSASDSEAVQEEVAEAPVEEKK